MESISPTAIPAIYASGTAPDSFLPINRSIENESYHEDDLLPISALQHLLFCPRQCALIHVEQLWAENQLTVEGMHLHEKADTPKHTVSGAGDDSGKGSVRVERALPLRSLELGLIGKADVVEFFLDEAKQIQRIVPVEYKRGRPKKDDSDRTLYAHSDDRTARRQPFYRSPAR
jgi:CRISPR/Cas system-associated exonuclease Cas4 (RecB family)